MIAYICFSQPVTGALIDDVSVIERISKHPGVWNPGPESGTPAGSDPPYPEGENIRLNYDPVPVVA